MTRISTRGRIRRTALLAAALGATVVGGCKVMTVEEGRALRARRGADFDATRYVDEIWTGKAMSLLRQKAVPAEQLLPAVSAGLDRAGAQFGRRVSEGSAWTFVVSGVGEVVSVDAGSRRGSADLVLSALVPARSVRLQVGPVVSGTAIRDALPFVAFNDFSDQLAFADVGRALTDRSLHDLKPALAALRPGQRVRFLGVSNLRDPGEPLVLTPVSITPDVGA